MFKKAENGVNRSKLRFGVLLLFTLFSFYVDVHAQILNADFPVLEEYLRRQQLLGEFPLKHSFTLRPIRFDGRDSTLATNTVSEILTGVSKIDNPQKRINVLPLISTTEINTKRPYGWGNKGLVPNVGIQTYLSAGVYARFEFLEIQFQPEFSYSQNKPFDGFEAQFSGFENYSRYFYWNNGDNPERFGNESIHRFWWGQSSVNILMGPMALGVSTQNIWWGPGQFNSLIFSDNSEGFPHLSLSTRRPLKTVVGNFEMQVIMGRLEDSGLFPSQNEVLNRRYFRRFDGDWRYLNGLKINYNPSFLKNFFLGFSRTFHQYSKYMGDSFKDYFPVFEVFQKKTLFENGNSITYDGRGQDQQVSLSMRYVVPKANFEIYAEYGRRDHAYNWRDFILNPDHARAYLFGFQKLFPIPERNSFLQVRGEMTQQQESVNRYVRYPGLIGNQTWNTHGLARAFGNYGENLGVGIGVGSNVQTLEITEVKGMMKRGILLERLENNQDYFFRAFGQNTEKKPWVDLSFGLLWDQRFDRLVLSGKAQFIKAHNYQWQSQGISTEDYPNGRKVFSFYGNLNIIYQLKK